MQLLRQRSLATVIINLQEMKRLKKEWKGVSVRFKHGEGLPEQLVQKENF